MTVELKHRTVATVEPSGEHEIDSPEWNETHVLTMATARILGRTATGTGDVQEISAGTGLTLSGLSLTFNSTWGDGRYALSGHDHSGVYEPVFTKNTAFNKNFGTAAGTVTQGNDSRLSNSREWTAAEVGQSEAEAGVASTARKWTALRVRQAIAAWWATITLSKADVGLSNVDNTSDANKPVSTAAQTALNSKLDLAGGTLTGTVIFHDTGVALKLPNIGTSNPAGTTNGDVWFAANTIRFNSNGTVRTVAHSAQWTLTTAAELDTGTTTTARLISAERLQTKLTNWWDGSAAKLTLDTLSGWGNHASAGYAPASRILTAGTGLTGGGTLAADRTFTVDGALDEHIWAAVPGKVILASELYTANAPVTTSGSGAITLNLTAGRKFRRTLTGASTLTNPSFQFAGQEGLIYIVQDATGGRTLAYGTEWKHLKDVPTIDTTPNAVNVFAYYVSSSGDVTLSYLGVLA